MKQLRARFRAFIETNKQYPVLIALASGLYPLMYNYNTNFLHINSWSQFIFFIVLFLIFPIIIFYLIHVIINKIEILKKYRNHIFTILNFSWFGFLILLSTKGLRLKLLAVVLLVAFCLGLIFRKHLNKAIVLQLFLASFVAVKIVPNIYDFLTYSDDWRNQPDDIENVVFKKRPNIYVIQPDGYANFSELRKENYNFDNSDFEMFLSNSGFKLYQNFRSNYYSTLSSNTSMFSMKHHYYSNPKKYSNELAKSREIIAGENPVVSTFKKNGYKTFFMMSHPYLIVNRPEIVYDYCNINYDEISYFCKGFEVYKDIAGEIETLIDGNTSTSNFFFIEQISPGHIVNSKSQSKGKELERIDYLTSLKDANDWLEKIISIITKNDKAAIIVIAADHGGFVGMTHIGQSESEDISDNDTLVKSIFSAALAIKWPNDPPVFDNKLLSSVNLFRILFTYLSQDEKYLKHLQSNESYTIIKKGDKFGTYMLINSSGEVEYERKN